MSLQLSVDRSSPVPLYFQLSQQLEAAIEHGVLTPGSLLGNEIELAGRLGLSRPTVRQAIQSLVDKGLLVRRRGVGTQVVHSQVKRPLELSSLYDDLEAAGQRPETQVLVNTVEPASAEVAAALSVAEGSEVHRVERLRLAHGEPMAYLCNHLPPGLLKFDSAQLEATGLYRLMRATGITLHSARQSIGARAATAEEGERLGEPAGRRCSPCSAPPSTTRAARSSSAPTPTGPRATPSSSSSSYGPDLRRAGRGVNAARPGGDRHREGRTATGGGHRARDPLVGCMIPVTHTWAFGTGGTPAPGAYGRPSGPVRRARRTKEHSKKGTPSWHGLEPG